MMIIDLSHQHVILLEQKLNYQFKNLELVFEALSHPSLNQEKSEHKNYERFEMLGDSILGFLITEILFNKYKNYEEGNLAKIKGYLVSKDVICLAAEKINLADFIIMTKGEENSGGRLNPNNIENTMEALIAAIYLDSSIDVVKNIINNLWSEFLHDFDLNEMDPKTSLQEWSQKNKLGLPHYKILQSEGPSHLPNFIVQVSTGLYNETGQAHSIKNAEKDAAKKLLSRVTTKHLLDE